MIAPAAGGPDHARVHGGYGAVFVAELRRLGAGCEPAGRPAAEALRGVLPALPAVVIWPPGGIDGDAVKLHRTRVPAGTDNAGTEA